MPPTPRPYLLYLYSAPTLASDDTPTYGSAADDAKPSSRSRLLVLVSVSKDTSGWRDDDVRWQDEWPVEIDD